MTDRMTDDLRTPEQWCERYGLLILDPDGWRTPDAPPWDQPIGLDEFWWRFARCTVRNVGEATGKRIAADLRATPSATVVPPESFDRLVAEADEQGEPNERTRAGVRRLGEAVQRRDDDA